MGCFRLCVRPCSVDGGFEPAFALGGTCFPQNGFTSTDDPRSAARVPTVPPRNQNARMTTTLPIQSGRITENKVFARSQPQTNLQVSGRSALPMVFVLNCNVGVVYLTGFPLFHAAADPIGDLQERLQPHPSVRQGSRRRDWPPVHEGPHLYRPRRRDAAQELRSDFRQSCHGKSLPSCLCSVVGVGIKMREIPVFLHVMSWCNDRSISRMSSPSLVASRLPSDNVQSLLSQADVDRKW